MNIEIHSGSFITKNSAYCTIVKATLPDGREKTIKLAKPLGKEPKNRADIISMIMALKCIKPEFRNNNAVLYSPPGYPSQVIDRNDDGVWYSNPRANLDIINEIRNLINSFTNITIKPENASNKSATFIECIEEAKKLC